ncbi:hypothetical protein [Paraclostridium dentum]|uniref:hypothetical protein n=1 Tax=Paraclostridium dentum TaxID=2662455 RepID=UPI003F2F1483
MEYIKSFTLKANIKSVPGNDHTSPIDYSIIQLGDQSYGLFDLDIAQGVDYYYKYDNETKELLIENTNGVIMKRIAIKNNVLTLLKNLNAIVTEFVVIDMDGNDTTIIVENTIKKFAPGTIYSPIIVLDENEQPLDLSSSYRVYNKANQDYYWFTNTEREYFNPAHMIRLTHQPSQKNNTIIVYGIKKESSLDLDNILRIPKEGLDTIDACANYYDLLFEKDLRTVNKEYKEITLTDISDYKLIIVDYLKEDSYAINYRHDLNSYEIDISIKDGEETSVVYNNAAENKEGITFINEYRYVNTKTVPEQDCYIVIGR